MKRLLITICVFIISLSAIAQEEQTLHFGIKASPSFAWLKSTTKGFDSNGSKFGFIYGLITEFKFAPNYSFATGIDISYRGGKIKTVENLKTVFFGEDSTISTESNYTMQYIELPITMKLKTNEIGSLTYYVQIGIAPALNISAKKSYDTNTQWTASGTQHSTPSSDDNIDSQDEINKFNLSMIIGAGVEYGLSGQTVLLAGLQFSNGFLDAFDSSPKVDTNYLALTLGVLF